MNPQTLFHSGFPHWLDEVIGSGTGAVPQGQVLDPFRSSLRNCGRATPWLIQVRDGNPLMVNDPTQAVGDMKAAGWVDRNGTDVVLTTLGTTLLDRWASLGVLDTDERSEAVRSAALIRVALELELADYQAMYAFWEQLVSYSSAKSWWTDHWSMFLPSYLNQADSAGFNPLSALVGATGGVGSKADWETLQADTTFPATVPLERMLSRVQSSRPGGRKSFLQGMEAYRLATREPHAFNRSIMGWNKP